MASLTEDRWRKLDFEHGMQWLASRSRAGEISKVARAIPPEWTLKTVDRGIERESSKDLK